MASLLTVLHVETIISNCGQCKRRRRPRQGDGGAGAPSRPSRARWPSWWRPPGLSRPTAHRLAVALEAHGLVRRDDDGRFCLGLRLIGLGHEAAEAVPRVGGGPPGAGLAPRADRRVGAAVRARRRRPRVRRVDRVAARAAHDRARSAPGSRCRPAAPARCSAARPAAVGRRAWGSARRAWRACRRPVHDASGPRRRRRLGQRPDPAPHPQARPEVRRPRRPGRRQVELAIRA